MTNMERMQEIAHYVRSIERLAHSLRKYDREIHEATHQIQRDDLSRSLRRDMRSVLSIIAQEMP